MSLIINLLTTLIGLVRTEYIVLQAVFYFGYSLGENVIHHFDDYYHLFKQNINENQILYVVDFTFTIIRACFMIGLSMELMNIRNEQKRQIRALNQPTNHEN